MRTPIRGLTDLFLRASPLLLLVVGAGVALLDFVLLYSASRHDGVLWISHGIGFLQDYGLYSTLVGDAIFFYLTRKYYDAVLSIQTSEALTDSASITEPLRALTSMIRIEREYRLAFYLLLTAGALYWTSNVGIHLLGNPEAHWHHKVFDSKDHPFAFVASRVHNLYTYIVVYPFVSFVACFTSVQLRRVFATSIQSGALKYDLLNPDHRGGFSFIDKSHMIFNLLIAVVYVQLSMHIWTFEHINFEHYVTLAVATLLLVFGNKIFLGNVYAATSRLRADALNATKKKVYDNDPLSFEILKFCYERRVNRYSVVNAATKVTAIGVSVGVKVFPLVSRLLTKA